MEEKIPNEEHDREADASFRELFESVEQPRPRAGFVDRTMLAVRQEALPPERRALQRPWVGAFGWAAVIAGVIGATYGAAANLPALVRASARSLPMMIRAWLWLLEFADLGLDFWDVLARTGRAFAKALVTTQGSTGLMILALVGAASLAMLQRLLVSEKEKESSSW